jgi:DNA-binding MarR family transcriptional regulator
MHVGFWLRCVSNQISQALSRKLEEQGVTLAEWMVLRELYDGALRPSTLADRLVLTRGAISKLARRLECKLMITQEAGSWDGRARMLAATDLGRAFVHVLAAHLDKTDEEFFGDLSADTRALLVSVMREIVRRRGSRAVPVD